MRKEISINLFSTLRANFNMNVCIRVWLCVWLHVCVLLLFMVVYMCVYVCVLPVLSWPVLPARGCNQDYTGHAQRRVYMCRLLGQTEGWSRRRETHISGCTVGALGLSLEKYSSLFHALLAVFMHRKPLHTLAIRLEYEETIVYVWLLVAISKSLQKLFSTTCTQ